MGYEVFDREDSSISIVNVCDGRTVVWDKEGTCAVVDCSICEVVRWLDVCPMELLLAKVFWVISLKVDNGAFRCVDTVVDTLVKSTPVDDVEKIIVFSVSCEIPCVMTWVLVAYDVGNSREVIREGVVIL